MMYVVMYRNEDGNWYLEHGRMSEGISMWNMDRSEAIRFHTRPFAEKVASVFEMYVSRDQIRGKVQVREVTK